MKMKRLIKETFFQSLFLKQLVIKMIHQVKKYIDSSVSSVSVKFQVGEIMNKHYINIKVDREERPDVDKVYMNFVQVQI